MGWPESTGPLNPLYILGQIDERTRRIAETSEKLDLRIDTIDHRLGNGDLRMTRIENDIADMRAARLPDRSPVLAAALWIGAEIKGALSLKEWVVMILSCLALLQGIRSPAEVRRDLEAWAKPELSQFAK